MFTTSTRLSETLYTHAACLDNHKRNRALVTVVHHSDEVIIICPWKQFPMFPKLSNLSSQVAASALQDKNLEAMKYLI